MIHFRKTLGTLFVVILTINVCVVNAQDTDINPVAIPSDVTPTVFENPDLVKFYQESITAEELASHLYIFSSDFFEGRETATRGQKLAALYLASQFRKLGLEPMGNVETTHRYDPEAYFQRFDVYSNRTESATLQVDINNETVSQSVFSAEKQDANAFLMIGTVPEVSGEVVFGGYGIADDGLKYNDYAAMTDSGIDAAGKWLLILQDEPLANDSTSLLPTSDGGTSIWSRSFYQKFRTARSSSSAPAGLLVVADRSPRSTRSVAENAGRSAAALNRVGRISTQEQSGGMTFLPIYSVSSELADKILAPSGRTIAAVQQEIDEKLEPVVFAVQGVEITSKIKAGSAKLDTENVLAYIEGGDPELKDEVVVVSAHYDHVGMDPSAEGDQIYNGADDDGSGAVATIEMAEAFMKAKADGFAPRRSILFLNVTAEEKGLVGSSYYTDVEPVFPLEKTVTDLNIDMIGRYDPTHPDDDMNYVYIIGSNLISEELHDINVKVNELTGINVILHERFNSKDDPNRFYQRSDHWNFGKHGIPFIFFFTGTHEDYHGVDDEAHKIDYDRMTDITRVIFATAWQVANQDHPPAVSGTGFN